MCGVHQSTLYLGHFFAYFCLGKRKSNNGKKKQQSGVYRKHISPMSYIKVMDYISSTAVDKYM